MRASASSPGASERTSRSLRRVATRNLFSAKKLVGGRMTDGTSREGVGILALLVFLVTAAVWFVAKIIGFSVQSLAQGKACERINAGNDRPLLNHPLGFGAEFAVVGWCRENEFELEKTAQSGLGVEVF